MLFTASAKSDTELEVVSLYLYCGISKSSRSLVALSSTERSRIVGGPARASSELCEMGLDTKAGSGVRDGVVKSLDDDELPLGESRGISLPEGAILM